MTYRETLQRLAGSSQSEHDKAVMTLSGGALGISFAFLKDVATPPPYFSGCYYFLAGCYMHFIKRINFTSTLRKSLAKSPSCIAR